MDNKNLDVDLDTLLGNKSEGTAPLGASAEIAEKFVDVEANQASARAQERIRELAEEVKTLKESRNATATSDFDSFINSIEDEPSRNLLKAFGGVMESKIRKEYEPLLSTYQTSKFEENFSQFEKSFPDLVAHKDDIRKTFERNPSQSLKALVGEKLVDIQSSRITPIEGQPSQASRTAPNMGDLSKDELYALLESSKN